MPVKQKTAKIWRGQIQLNMETMLTTTRGELNWLLMAKHHLILYQISEQISQPEDEFRKQSGMDTN